MRKGRPVSQDFINFNSSPSWLTLALVPSREWCLLPTEWFASTCWQTSEHLNLQNNQKIKIFQVNYSPVTWDQITTELYFQTTRKNVVKSQFKEENWKFAHDLTCQSVLFLLFNFMVLMESLLSHLFHNYQREQLICANSTNHVSSRSMSLPHYGPIQHT